MLETVEHPSQVNRCTDYLKRVSKKAKQEQTKEDLSLHTARRCSISQVTRACPPAIVVVLSRLVLDTIITSFRPVLPRKELDYPVASLTKVSFLTLRKDSRIQRDALIHLVLLNTHELTNPLSPEKILFLEGLPPVNQVKRPVS